METGWMPELAASFYGGISENKRSSESARITVDRRTVDPRLMTAEHVQPVWDGGRSVAGNVVAACFECNNARSSSPSECGGSAF